MEGLLSESVCKRAVHVRSEPITDNYTVEARPFARGKFAAVRRCRHRTTGVEYAAKYMRKRRRASDVRHEILHEALVLELSRRHPHIVRMHEVYETPSEIVLVLELVPGGELQRVLDDEEVVPEREAARLLRQILDGVAFLHQHKIAHLDLKPQNLLLTKPFPEGEVKLCDFGISRLITKGIEIREIVGTPDYVAPEVLHYEPISLPTDMWSLGILTYVLLSGHSPFGGDTKQETFCNITRGTLDFPSDLFGNISSCAKDFIQRLLLRNPRERMTAEECLSHPWLSGGEPTLPGIQLTLSPESVQEHDNSHLSETSPRTTGRESPAMPRRKSPSPGHLKDSVFRKSPSPKVTRSADNNVFSKSSPLKGTWGVDNSISCKGSSNGDQKDNCLRESSSLNTVDHLANGIFCKSSSPKVTRSADNDLLGKSPSPKGTWGVDKSVFCKGSSNGNVTNDKKDNCFRESSSPNLNDTADSMANGIFSKSPSPHRNGSAEQKVGSFRKSPSPKPGQKEQKSRSVDMMVSQFEGISMSKRIVFSEEIIVDERVGMVY